MKKVINCLFFLSFITACSSPSSMKYEVIDSYFIDSTGFMNFTVFTPDTNWVEMQKFAEELTKKSTDPRRVGVGFFNPKEKTPKFLRPSASIGTACITNIVAMYNFDRFENKLILHKTDNPKTNKEMSFK